MVLNGFPFGVMSINGVKHQYSALVVVFVAPVVGGCVVCGRGIGL